MQHGRKLDHYLEYFGKVYGKTVSAVAPQYTSQECSNCGNLVKKTLSTRTHICGCGTILDRDHNAALNILAKGLKQSGIDLNTVGHTEIHAGGQTDLYSMVATKQRQVRLADPRIPSPLGRGVSN